jgi:hypothetical protein
MKPLTIIYWIRAGLGLVIGILCALYVYSTVSTEVTSIYTLLTGISFALLFYIATYYLIKSRYFGRVEKQSKLITQGIGIYFFAWLVSWTLIISLFMPSITVNISNTHTGGLVEGLEYWVVAENSAGQVIRNVTTTTGTLRMTLLPPDTYTFKLGNSSGISPYQEKLALDWLQSEDVTFSVPWIPG